MVFRSLLFAFILFGSKLSAQDKLFKQRMFKDLKVTNTITKSYGDSSITFHVAALEEDVTPEFDNRYYWFNGGEIKTTQGAYTGKLLHGSYEKFDRNGILLEKGEFNNGMREGMWLSWYGNGTVASKYNWSEGRPIGKFSRFYPNGNIEKTGVYKRGRLDGKLVTYTPQGELLSEEKYSKGKFIPAKEKKVKEKKSKGKRTKSNKSDSLKTPAVDPALNGYTQPQPPAETNVEKKRSWLKKKSKDEIAPNYGVPPTPSPAPIKKKKERKKKEASATESTPQNPQQ